MGKLGLGAFLIGGTIGDIYFGALSDRIGRVRTIVITILVYSLFTCLTAFAQSAWQVVALRLFVAIGVCGEWAVASALVAEVFPAFARVRALGIFHSISTPGSYLAIAAGLFIVGDSQQLYDRRYGARGEMENRIKEQMMLIADRVSAHRWWANQWRIPLSALAYTLTVGLRRLAWAGAALARATCATLRLKLIKIGTVIVRSASRVRVHLSSPHPCREIFLHACGVLSPPR